jgi:hypothetical protein
MMDMFSAARRLASQWREVFEALVAEGFTEEQAMRMLLVMMGTPING